MRGDGRDAGTVHVLMSRLYDVVKRRKAKAEEVPEPAADGEAPGDDGALEHDHQMDSLVADTRLELGSRCLEAGDYDAGILAYTAVLRHAPLGSRAAEARRGLMQCQKGQKLVSLGTLEDEGDAGVQATLEHLGVPQWSDPATPMKSQGATDGPEAEAPRVSQAVGLEPEPEPEPEPELTTRAAQATQVEALEAEADGLRTQLAEKTSALDEMVARAAEAAARKQKEELSRGEEMRNDIKGAMKAEKQRRYVPRRT